MAPSLLSEKKVFIHDSVIDPVHQRGVDRCFYYFSYALADEFPGRALFFSKRRMNLPRIRHYFPVSHYLKMIDPFPRRIRDYLDQKHGQFIADTKADFYYSPYYGKIKTQIPQVFTAHDMIYEKFPKYFSYDGAKEFIKEKRDCFERASLILCVSKNTAKDILSFYPQISENKIKVVYNGVSEFFHAKLPSQVTEKPYFLFVGNRNLYKNFHRLLIAYGVSNLSNDFDLRVISPINDFPTDSEKELINRYHLQDHIHINVSVTDEDLKKYYQESLALVFPSEYEGFGLPILEAMASGTLVLASGTSSILEIGGDIPLYFDPLSIESIVEILNKAVSLPAIERQERINKGKLHSMMFSWEISKKRFIDAINSLK